ncbi:hypothetical protein ACIQAA_23960 [Neobacillus sp. NPDC093182]|uniref:hypothetical protein n=1 Tax=Neobacillus sp. NPDC093182 TaxID=3364297 RepID=UPI0038057A4E
MKKIVTLLCTSLIVFLMFVGSGNVAFAHGECGCITEEITGAEKNKIVSDLLKSNELKNAKKLIKQEGYKWNGVGNVEVIYNVTHKTMMIGIPVTYSDGTVWTAAFFNGFYMGVTPPDSHEH